MVPENKRQENTKTPWFFPENNDERIEVSNLPIIKTRKLMEGSLPIESPENLLEVAQIRLNELTPIVSVVIKGNSILIDSQTIQLSPIIMMVWRYFARNKIEKCASDPGSICPGCTGCYVSHNTMIDELDKSLLNEYALIVGENSERYENFNAKLADLKMDANGWSEKDKSIREYRSKLKKQLKEKAPYSLLRQLIPDITEDEDGNAAFGIKMAKNVITFDD